MTFHFVENVRGVRARQSSVPEEWRKVKLLQLCIIERTIQFSIHCPRLRLKVPPTFPGCRARLDRACLQCDALRTRKVVARFQYSGVVSVRVDVKTYVCGSSGSTRRRASKAALPSTHHSSQAGRVGEGRNPEQVSRRQQIQALIRESPGLICNLQFTSLHHHQHTPL